MRLWKLSLLVFSLFLDQASSSCRLGVGDLSVFLSKSNVSLQSKYTRLRVLVPSAWKCAALNNATRVCPAPLQSIQGCTICPSGTYGKMGSTCTPCTAGYFCVGGNRTVCPAGFLSLEGASQCTVPCPAGSYCPQVGYALPCPTAGTYSLGGAAYNCTICKGGYQCPTFVSQDFCPANTWSAPGSTSCALPCPAGVTCPGNGAMGCTVCPSNSFIVRACSATGGDTICNTTCPPGMFGAFYTNGFCQNCGTGTYNSDYGMTTCRTCTDGYFANQTGASQCQHCAADSNTNIFTGFVNCQKVCRP